MFISSCLFWRPIVSWSHPAHQKKRDHILLAEVTITAQLLLLCLFLPYRSYFCVIFKQVSALLLLHIDRRIRASIYVFPCRFYLGTLFNEYFPFSLSLSQSFRLQSRFLIRLSDVTVCCDRIWCSCFFFFVLLCCCCQFPLGREGGQDTTRWGRKEGSEPTHTYTHANLHVCVFFCIHEDSYGHYVTLSPKLKLNTNFNSNPKI